MDIDRKKFFEIVNRVGVSVVGQSGNLVPADKKLYALRDVTATVESIPLIAQSIMSKKLAAGSDCILLDVKCGNGAFMKDEEDAISLAKKMVTIGNHNQKKTVALVTNMNVPLGNAIGNSLEVIEAIETLQGRGPADLTVLCIQLAAHMLHLAQKGSLAECEKMAEKTLKDKSAFCCFKDMVQAQGGDVCVLENTELFEKAPYCCEVLAKARGYVSSMDTMQCGLVSGLLGAGRKTKESQIDYQAGILLKKKTGDLVNEGEVLAVLYTSKEETLIEAAKKMLEAYEITKEAPKKLPLIIERIS